MRFSIVGGLALTAATTARASISNMVSGQVFTEHPINRGLPQRFTIKRSGGEERTEMLAYEAPEGVEGPCVLVASFPDNFPLTLDGNTQVDFVDFDGPQQGEVVGSIRLGQKSAKGKRSPQVIHAGPCRERMVYELKLHGDQDGEVSFLQVLAAGVFLEYGV